MLLVSLQQMSKGWGQAAEFAQFLHSGWIVKCFTAVSVARLETKAQLQRQIWIIEEKPRRQIWKLWQEMRQCWPNYPPAGQLAPKSANWVNEGKKCLITSKHKNLKTVRKLRICQMKCCFVNVFMGYSFTDESTVLAWTIHLLDTIFWHDKICAHFYHLFHIN